VVPKASRQKLFARGLSLKFLPSAGWNPLEDASMTQLTGKNALGVTSYSIQPLFGTLVIECLDKPKLMDPLQGP
jgi:hypothetical protein